VDGPSSTWLIQIPTGKSDLLPALGDRYQTGKHIQNADLRRGQWKDAAAQDLEWSNATAARGIEDEFGTQKTLSYLVGEKFLNFLEAADDDRDFRAELPAFVAEIKVIFERWQLSEYLNTARQTEPFDRSIYAEEDREEVERMRQPLLG